MTSNELVKRDESGLVIVDYGETGVTGFENQSEDDRSKVWLKLLQSMSRECKNRTRVEGAEPGKFYHTGTGRLWDGEEGVDIVACITESGFVEWKPDGGGFVARHANKHEPVVRKAREYSEERGIFPWRLPMTNPNGDTVPGNIIKETKYIHLLCPGLRDEDPWEFASMAFDSYKIKPYQSIMDDLHKYRVMNSKGEYEKPPLFSVVLRITSYDAEENGKEICKLDIKPAGGKLADSHLTPSDPRFQAAKMIAQGFLDGSVQVDYASAKDDTDSNSSSDAFGDEF